MPFLLLRKEIEENRSPWPPPVVAIADIYVYGVKYRTFNESWAALTHFERGRDTRVPGVAIMLYAVA